MWLSRFQAEPLIAAREAGKSAWRSSLDLNRSRREATFDAEGVDFGEGVRISWEGLRTIAESERTVYQRTEDGDWAPVRLFSEDHGRLYQLSPTEGAPTMLVASFPMHRTVGVDPIEDTRRKIATLAPVEGRVLDVCTGLGYTAIHAARTARQVVTVELDPAALEMCHHNPWSIELFENERIESRIGDALDVLPALPSGGFDRIFHDPPTFQLAGELYSEAFYRQLRRVLKRSGKLFHYLGDLESRHGAKVAEGAMRRLHQAGFAKVRRAPEAFGLVAW